MTVATFIQPNFSTQDPIDVKTNIQNCFVVHNRIAGSFAAHEQDPADMTIKIDAGSLMVLGNVLEVAGQDTPTIAAPTDPVLIYRIDRVLVNATTGIRSVVTGTPHASFPAIPAITTGYIPICRVLLTTGMTEISNLLITDERIMGGGGGKEAIAIDGIYMTMSTNSPEVDLGYGTWAPIGSGRIPIGVSPDFPEGTTGGSKTADVSHSHGLACDAHSHELVSSPVEDIFQRIVEPNYLYHNEPYGTTGTIVTGVASLNTGSINIMNPYFACYFWRRTA